MNVISNDCGLNKRIAHASVWFGRNASCLHLQVAKSNLQLIHLSIQSLCEEVILIGNNVNIFCVVFALFILFRGV